VQIDLKRTEALIRRRWKEDGYVQLLPEEQDYIVLWWLQVEVDNGGFEQYFFNSAGDGARQANTALVRLGATRSAQILEEALQVIDPAGGYNPDRILRQTALATLPEGAFDTVTDHFSDREDDFVAMALDSAATALSAIGLEEEVCALPQTMCPNCSTPLRTPKARQCRPCGHDWH